MRIAIPALVLFALLAASPAPAADYVDPTGGGAVVSDPGTGGGSGGGAAALEGNAGGGKADGNDGNVSGSGAGRSIPGGGDPGGGSPGGGSPGGGSPGGGDPGGDTRPVTPAPDSGVWFPDRVNNTPTDKEGADAAIRAAYVQYFGREPAGDEHLIHVNSVTGNWATLQEVLANIAAAAGQGAGAQGAAGGLGTPGAGGGGAGGGGVPPGAFGTDSTHAPADHLDPFFRRGDANRIDEDMSQTYTCPQENPDEPQAHPADLAGRIKNAILGVVDWDNWSNHSDGTRTCNGPRMKEPGPMPDIQFHWSATDPEGRSLAGGSGRSLTVHYADPSEPRVCEVKCRIKYKYKDWRVQGVAEGVQAAQAGLAALRAQAQGFAASVKDGSVVEPPAVTVSHGSGDGGSFQASICFTVNYKVPHMVPDESTPDPDDEKQDGWDPASKSFPGSYPCGGWSAKPLDDRETPWALLHQTVVDVTCPVLRLLPCGLDVDGNIPGTTGDFILVRCEISDNNRYADIREAWLNYETKPSWGSGLETWAGAPLRLEIDGSKPGPPFNPNKGNYKAMTPLPWNVKGHKALRWYVDNHDGSLYSNHCGAGNHNKGDLAHDGTAPKPDTHNTDYGYISLFDNDRPNIRLAVWEVTRSGIERIALYEAAEEYGQPDMFNSHDQIANWSGTIPSDADLQANPPVLAVPPELAPYVLEPVREAMERAFAAQRTHYDFAIGGHGEVMHEDRKYVFVADVNDNVEFVCNNLVMTPVKKVDRTTVSWRFREPSENIDMGSLEEVPRAGGGKWYLSTADPNEMVAGTGSRDCYAFEHIFHTKIEGSAPADACFLDLKAVDTAGHERTLHLTIRIGDVKSDFQTFDEKLERGGTASGKRGDGK